MAPSLTIKQWVLSHIILLLCLLLCLQQFLDITNNHLSLSILDIGQGDAILIQTPEYKNILIDASLGSQVVDRLSEQLGFFEKNIDLFIMTHPDRDHYAGIMDVLKKYQVKQIMLTGIANPDRLYLSFLDEVKRQNIPIVFPENNQDLQISHNAYLDILFPFAGQSLVGQVVKNKNATSIVTRLLRKEGGQWHNLAILTGDAEHKQERELLLSGQDVQGDILKLGHHGAKTSSSDVFVNAVRAKIAVVSAGKDNSFGHPHPDILEKVKDLDLRNTITDGTVEFNF